MITYTTIEQKYCVHVNKNIVVETVHYSNGSSKTECLSRCKAKDSGKDIECSYFKGNEDDETQNK